MTKSIRALLDQLNSADREARYKAFTQLIKATNTPVTWAYEAWDQLIDLTSNGDNHQRTIGVQLLANLTKSDRDRRIVKDIGKLIRVTKDPMFVTARHSLLCLWKIGVKDADHRKLITGKLAKRFKECISEKNGTLIRYDILSVFRRIHDDSPDEKLHSLAMRLIETETDTKYRKKYLGLWK